MMDETKKKLKAQFIENRGYWSSFWDDVLELDKTFFSAYSKFSSIPSKNNALSPKIREFIYIAIDASTTHLYLPGLKLHMENALALGATRDEIMEVLELTSVLGIHTCTLGVPILIEELRELGRGDEIDDIEYGEYEKGLKETFKKIGVIGVHFGTICCGLVQNFLNVILIFPRFHGTQEH